MGYCTFDLSETLKALPEEENVLNVIAVIAAWGEGSSGYGNAYAGDCCSEWQGGFLLQLRDGRFAYVSGWCDYTGWGCQDGVDCTVFDTEPALTDLEKIEPGKHDCLSEREQYGKGPISWDKQPADLNAWVARGMKDEV